MSRVKWTVSPPLTSAPIGVMLLVRRQPVALLPPQIKLALFSSNMDFTQNLGLTQDERRFIQHFYKIDRWLYHQCDDMIAYYYDNLPNITQRTARTATSGNSRPALHHLYLPKTKDRIDILIEQLPERERNAVLAINSGTTYRQLAEQLGVSYNRAQQLVNRGELQIRRWLRQSS